MRIGLGYDIHPLGKGRKLILGGIEIPHTQGLVGHSDADALVHAVCDALLGAMGEGDLGKRFPSSDPSPTRPSPGCSGGASAPWGSIVCPRPGAAAA